MRLRGTGNTPPGVDQCPKGLIFDALPEQGEALIEKGWAEEVAPEDDLGRTRLQMANSAVRGEQFTDPDDLKIGDEWFGVGDNPLKGKDPYPAVQSQDVGAKARDLDHTEGAAVSEGTAGEAGSGAPGGSTHPPAKGPASGGGSPPAPQAKS